MKYFATILALTIFALATVYSAPPPAPPTSAQGQGADTEAPGMFGYTPVPKSTPVKAGGPKQPLTASLAKDDKGKSPSTFFAPSDTTYVLWKDPTGSKGDKVRTVWYAEDAGKFPKNKKLSEFTQTIPAPGAFGSAASPTIKGGLPPGKYRADVYDGAKLAVKLPFTIK